MPNKIHQITRIKSFSSILMVSTLICTNTLAEVVNVPSGTQVYVETDQPVSGKKKHTQEGQVVRASIWRDVVVNDATVIKAGAPVLVRVDNIKGAHVAGIKGKMTLGAYDTQGIDSSKINLDGGYLKEGKGRVALTATLAAVVFLPLIFIKGKSANLPRGTVFDAYTSGATDIEVGARKTARKTLSLAGAMGPRLEVEVLYDELEGVDEPETFAFAISAPSGTSGDFVIDKVNGTQIEDALELESKKTNSTEDGDLWRGEIKIKKLGKELQKGINTFDVATTVGGERVAEEVVLDIQF